jgi:HEPN domain-containing protein
MQPSTARDFQKAAAQRLNVASFLLQNKYSLDAAYIAGYTVECSLKALLLEKTVEPDRPGLLRKITSGASMHRPEILLAILRDKGITLPLQLARRFRRINWSTSLRYEAGRRDTGETRGFIKTARTTLQWVEGQLP